MQIPNNTPGSGNPIEPGTIPPKSEPQSSSSSTQSSTYAAVANSLRQLLTYSGNSSPSAAYTSVSNLGQAFANTLQNVGQSLTGLFSFSPSSGGSTNSPIEPGTPGTGNGSFFGGGVVPRSNDPFGGGLLGSLLGGARSAPVSSTPAPVIRPIPANASELPRTNDTRWQITSYDGKGLVTFDRTHGNLADTVHMYAPDRKTVLATGTRIATTPDGRPIFSFDKPGNFFPPGSVVAITLKDGLGVRTLTIPDPSQNYTHGSRNSQSQPSNPATPPPPNSNPTPTTPPNQNPTPGTSPINSGNLTNLFPTPSPSNGSGSQSSSVSQPPAAPIQTLELEKNGENEWSPQANNGMLSVTFGKAYADGVESVQIFSADGRAFDVGVRAGTTPDGRPIFNFQREGADYPDGASVVMTLKNGQGKRTMMIPDTAQSYIHGTRPSAPPTTPPASSTTPPSSNLNNLFPPSGIPQTPIAPVQPPPPTVAGAIEWSPRPNNANLAVILDKSFSELTEKIQIVAADGRTFDFGVRAGTTPDGRPIFNFRREGADYPDGASVVVTLKNGLGVRKITVAETSRPYSGTV